MIRFEAETTPHCTPNLFIVLKRQVLNIQALLQLSENLHACTQRLVLKALSINALRA